MTQTESDHGGSHMLTRKISGLRDFKRVHSNLPAEVTVEVGDHCSVTVSGDEHLLDAIAARVAFGTLTLKTATGAPPEAIAAIKVHVVMARLERITLAGAGDVVVRELRKTHTLAVHTEADSSGRVSVQNGDLLYLNVAAKGSGKIDTHLAKAREVTVESGGSGKVEVTCHASVRVRLEAAGDVVVWGNPRGRVVQHFGTGLLVYR